MNVRQKLCEPFDGLKIETINELENIADDYAIKFMEWYFDLDNEYIAMLSAKKLLEIFKKENEL